MQKFCQPFVSHSRTFCRSVNVDLCLQLSFLRFFNVTATVFGQVLVLIWHWLMENWSIVLV
jgi:hypothetical protein